ncbi:amidohydrolase [Roseiterribacter gracilis]|uniref:Imidazolonepropionase related amidohydrolase n=1 Tax=Roseiterribacter gracilis TaxID=2812848 RepID=A0A8S8XD75_9PROT|nr:imidazolonepropionase related amidohydrolase [Rhodospirillales bacterium TMPK1]
MRGRTQALLLAGLLLAVPAAAQEQKQAAKQPSPFGGDAYPSTYKPLPRTDTLLRGATIFDGAERKFDNADLLLRDGKVAAIGSNLAADGATVIDAKGRFITPGIIDIHSHDGSAPAPLTKMGSDVGEETDPNSANVWIEHAINPQDAGFWSALSGGVTTMQILPGSGNLFGGRTVVLKNVPGSTSQQMKFPGAAQGLKMACGENPKSTWGSKGRFPSSRMGIVAGYREGFQRAADYLRKWNDYQAGSLKEPPVRDFKLDTLAGVLRGEIKVHIHCYRADEMATVLEVAKEFGFKVAAFHHAIEAYKIPDLLKRDGACAVVWPDWWGGKAEAYDGIRENAAFVDAAGACVTLHSDIRIAQSRLNVELAKAVAAGRRAGLNIPTEHAIAWITRNPATVLGIADRTGSLEVGKNADLVVWSGDPLSIYSRADQVFVDGARIYDRSDPTRQPLTDTMLGQPVTKAVQ